MAGRRDFVNAIRPRAALHAGERDANGTLPGPERDANGRSPGHMPGHERLCSHPLQKCRNDFMRAKS
jgi:hypothetical protein